MISLSQLTKAAIGLTWTSVATAPRYCLHSDPRISGLGEIENHCWKNKLKVGVRTSDSTSLVPMARSLRNGRSSAASRGVDAAGFAEEEEVVRGSPAEGVPAVIASRMGKNSAGPVARLTLDNTVCLRWTHYDGCGNIVGSSSVMPQYEMIKPFNLSNNSCHCLVSSGPHACCQRSN